MPYEKHEYYLNRKKDKIMK